MYNLPIDRLHTELCVDSNFAYDTLTLFNLYVALWATN